MFIHITNNNLLVSINVPDLVKSHSDYKSHDLTILLRLSIFLRIFVSPFAYSVTLKITNTVTKRRLLINNEKKLN